MEIDNRDMRIYQVPRYDVSLSDRLLADDVSVQLEQSASGRNREYMFTGVFKPERFGAIARTLEAPTDDGSMLDQQSYLKCRRGEQPFLERAWLPTTMISIPCFRRSKQNRELLDPCPCHSGVN